MGHKHSKKTSPGEKHTSFKLFEYQCSNCSAKRPIQYFYRNGTFLPQQPRVVCGGCNTSLVVEPFKTVDYECPSCRKWQRARMPARPIPLNMYNVSVVSCNCGFRGEVSIGRLMDVACSHCWAHKRELRDVWIEEGDEVKTYCEPCQDYRRAYTQAPKKKGGGDPAADMEYTCENCFRVRPIHAEELLRSEGLASCSLCKWVGYPEVRPRGSQQQSSAATPKGHASGPSPKGASSSRRSTGDRKARVKPAPIDDEPPDPAGVVPTAS